MAVAVTVPVPAVVAAAETVWVDVSVRVTVGRPVVDGVTVRVTVVVEGAVLPTVGALAVGVVAALVEAPVGAAAAPDPVHASRTDNPAESNTAKTVIHLRRRARGERMAHHRAPTGMHLGYDPRPARVRISACRAASEGDNCVIARWLSLSTTGDRGISMMGIDALDGFLPRRYKERHVLIREMVACLDAVQGESVEVGRPASKHREAVIAVAGSPVD